MLVHTVEWSTAVVKVDIKVINASLTQNQCNVLLSVAYTAALKF